MARNIELKARAHDLEAVRAKAGALTTDPPQLIEFGSFGSENRTQDGVERDAHRRRQRGERRALGPSGDLTQRLFFDDVLVVLDALAVEGRSQQAAPLAVLVAVQFWYLYGGGTLVMLYLPLILLMMFRPNLASKRPVVLESRTKPVR